MALNLESLSDDAKTALLARIAHTLTICARDTYEVGTENVLNPQMLRAYNELLHQVIGSVLDRLAGSRESVESTIEVIRSFGIEQDRVEEVDWALKCALQSFSGRSLTYHTR
jgi:hypothetical protein